jgi:uncharacterized protein with von Willebrand factor type A (vWA) domain
MQRRRSRLALASEPSAVAADAVDDERLRIVESDRYDRAAIARLRRTSEAWREVEAEGGRLVPGFGALLDDLFCALFKMNVLVLPSGQTPASTAFARRILASVLAGPAYQALRLHTLLDEARAGLGAVLLAEGLVRALREERVLTSGDLLDLWRLAEAEEEAAEKEAEGDVAREVEESSRTEGEEPDADAAPAEEGDDASELRDAARAIRSAARGAAGHREQKRKQVEESLDRVGSRLDRSLLGAAAKAATKVQDLPDALASWGRGLGAGAPKDAGASVDLGRRLADNPKLKRLAKIFGRVRDEALAARRRVLDRADQEMHEIGPIATLEDLSRLVPRELVALSHPLLRRDFQRRLLEGELLTYRLRGVDARGRGSVVVCLDVSSSMSGDKEIWAKAVALTFVELARRGRRRSHVICFSSDASSLREFDMNPRTPYEVSLARTLDLAEHFTGGGTDFVPPLEAASALIGTREHRKSDVVLITDGESQVTPAWQDEFLKRKRKRNFSLYSILVDVRSSRTETIDALSDRVSRVSDLEADTRDLFVRRRST